MCEIRATKNLQASNLILVLPWKKSNLAGGDFNLGLVLYLLGIAPPYFNHLDNLWAYCYKLLNVPLLEWLPY